MIRITTILFIATLSVAVLQANAAAEELPSTIDVVAVSASRIDAAVGEQSRSVEVISRAEIENRQAPNVTELLRQVAGLTVIQQGGRGNVTSVLMRGGEPNFTVVLIDGQQINDPTNTRGGSYDFSYLDPSSIDRIEIVRGPMSAQYGSDSLAGVINIVTRKGEDGSGVRVGVGDHGFRTLNAAVGVESGPIIASIRAHALNDDGTVPGGGYDDFGANASLRMKFNPDTVGGVNARFLDADSTGFPEDSGGPAFAELRQLDVRDVQEMHAVGYLNHRVRSNLSADLTAGRYQREELFASPGIAAGVFDGVPPNSADTRFIRDRVELNMTYSFSPAASVNVGGQWQHEDGRSEGVLDVGFTLPTNFNLKRDTVSAFAESQWHIDKAVLQASLRWDKPDDVGSQTSAQVGAVIDLGESKAQLRANWGQGFKAPSFFALAHPLVGNPDLLSEEANSVEVGLRYRLVDGDGGNLGDVELTLFESTFENLIDFDPVQFTNVNRSEVVNSGAELSGSLRLTDTLTVRGHVTYLDSDIKDSDARLRGRPNWRVGGVVDWRINTSWQLIASVLASDDVFEVSIPTGSQRLSGYERMDVTVNYRPTDRWHLGLAIDNLLDERYQEAIGFQASGTRGRLSLGYRF